MPTSPVTFGSMADSMPEMVWTAQPDGSLDFCNRRWLECTGLTFPETMGFGWLRVIHADDRASAEDAWALSLALGRAFEARLDPALTTNGATVPH